MSEFDYTYIGALNFDVSGLFVKKRPYIRLLAPPLMTPLKSGDKLLIKLSPKEFHVTVVNFDDKSGGCGDDRIYISAVRKWDLELEFELVNG